jgi:hypothetical protein
MTLTIRALAKLFIIMLAATLPAAPSHAGSLVLTYMSATGTGNVCSVTQPCTDFSSAIGSALSATGQGRVICLSPVSGSSAGAPDIQGSGLILEIDCPLGGFQQALRFEATGSTERLRGMTLTGAGGLNYGLLHDGSGTLILEDCKFVDTALSGSALDIEPVGPLNLVIRNCRISNSSGGGILLKPNAGGSINATLDHVTIADNSGGGIKIDTTNGPVTLDITDSVVSGNSGNGVNAVGNAGGQTMVSIKNSVIAKNGATGVQANGANAGVLMQMTLLDQNAAGATAVVNGGGILTYGNNSIVGARGAGFTGSAGLQ